MVDFLSSPLTRTYRVTLPVEVRRVLGLEPGDRVQFRVEDSRVVLTRSGPCHLAYLKALEGTLLEWNSPHDNEAFADL